MVAETTVIVAKSCLDLREAVVGLKRSLSNVTRNPTISTRDGRKQTIAESLLTSDKSSQSKLRSPVPSDTYKRLEDLAKYLDPGNGTYVQAWIKSAKFKPYFGALYDKAILP